MSRLSHLELEVNRVPTAYRYLFIISKPFSDEGSLNSFSPAGVDPHKQWDPSRAKRRAGQTPSRYIRSV